MSTSIPQQPQSAQAQAQVHLKNAQVKVEYLVAQLSKYPVLNKLEAQTKVPKAIGAIAVFFLMFLSIFFNIGAQPITNLIGLVVPAYYSVQAIESPGHADDIQWLTYWISFAFFNFVENFSSTLLHYFPFYYVFKTVAIIYLVLPQTRGAETFYVKLVRPIVFSGARVSSKAPASADDLKSRISNAVEPNSQ